MELLGRPPPAYGLKFLVKAGSPDPVMTRHLWPALAVPAPSVAAGAEAPLARTARAASARAAVASERVRVVRRIGCPFSPGSGEIAVDLQLVRKRFRNGYHVSEAEVKPSPAKCVQIRRSWFRNVPERA